MVEETERLSYAIKKIQDTLSTAETHFKALDNSADILFKVSGKLGVPEARQVLAEILDISKNCIQFVEAKKDEELTANVDYLVGADVGEEYVDLQTKWNELVTFLVEKNVTVVADPENYDRFRSEFDAFKKSYISKYLEEHNFVNEMRANFCKGFEDNTHFKLLKQMGSINNKLIRKNTDSIRAFIVEYRGKTCSVKGDNLSTILKDETTCTLCERKLEGKNKAKEEIEIEENEVISEIREEGIFSLKTLLQSLETNKPLFQKLLEEKEKLKDGQILLEVLQKILKKPSEATEKEFDLILKTSVNLEGLLKKVTEAMEVTPPKPHSISKILREFKEKVGTKATLGDLIKWMRNKIGEKEEIDIDVS